MSNEPSYLATSFACPACDAHTGQTWVGGGLAYQQGGHSFGVVVALCQACRGPSVWGGPVGSTTGIPVAGCVFTGVALEPTAAKMLHPAGVGGPAAHGDLPESARADFEEARSIVRLSPRAAAALLRLTLQKLCIHLGQPGKNLNDDIGALVREGLGTELQQAFDVLRVTGNHAVHPGALDLRDDPATVSALFDIINMIVEKLIAQPARIREMYDRLPATALDAIERRDGASS